MTLTLTLLLLHLPLLLHPGAGHLAAHTLAPRSKIETGDSTEL